ncbi:MAG TPA: RNA methyltransferase [Myxococcales bacterium]|nr:RNA methyltransferase [Myxococcales bacterium]
MGVQPVLEPAQAGAAKARWIATCPDETKGVLAEELAGLGVRDARPIYRGVAFEADLETGYRAHLWLRTASRIQRIVAELPAEAAAALEASAASVPWPSWLLGRYPFSVSAILTDDAARTVGEAAVQAAIANAVARSFSAAGLSPPRFDAGGGGKVTLIAHLRGGVCTLGLDTAGRALHKRGWRLGGHPAVLKETLAASVLLLAGYDGTEPLLDPMCGSGTLAIEGAYIALHKAPLIHRGKDDFGFELQAGFDRPLWRRISDQARAAKLPAPAAPLFASDVRAAWVELARKTALRARVERHISFSVASLHELEPPASSGLLVANLPYGERLEQAPALYREVGRTLRQRFSAWRVALLVPAAAPAEALGLAPQREIALMNGALPVRVLLFAP